MKLPVNPYKTKDNPQQVRKVLADVGVEDWLHLVQSWPFRGLQDVIIATLFHKFITELKKEGIQPHYDPTNITKIKDILRRASFSRADRD